MLEPSVFRLAKDGSTRAEYEDAIAWSRRRRRFAVADGASASAFARLWAQLLVRAYVSGALRAETLEADIRQRVERRLDDGLVERCVLRPARPLRFVWRAAVGIRGGPRHI